MPPQKQKLQIDIPISKSLFGLLSEYKLLVVALVILTILSNALNLLVPRIISKTIDGYGVGTFVPSALLIEFAWVSLGIFLFTYLQNILQVVTGERVARDLRTRLLATISEQTSVFVDTIGPSKLLTNLTSDIDAVKSFVSTAISSIVSSVVLIIGAAVLLLFINWKLALAVLLVVPIIAVTFFYILGKVRKLFTRSQEAIDGLNAVINESILGSSLIRLLNAQQYEYQKFITVNTKSKDIGMSIIKLFSTLIPVITFCTSLATLTILLLGGYFVISGSMSLGSFTAFTSYLGILIFPILIIGFMSNVIAQSTASYNRITEVMLAPREKRSGTNTNELKGAITAENITLLFGDTSALKKVRFDIKAQTKTAIVGPTAAGKTQLLYILSGLINPTLGTVLYDGIPIDDYNKARFHDQVGFVFQDSVLFNLSLRENIAFSNDVSDANLSLSIMTSELADFIKTLPQGLDTIVSERGTSLSGGQRQRIMLARALALNPRILLLDDFTARLDTNTERAVLRNIALNYPDITLVSVTQKISTIEHYDQIILLMEGEVLAIGTHVELLATSPEYVQMYESQKSTNQYELQT